MTVTVRFAPSPTGKLHVGNVRAALWNWLFARANSGKFILRIDDTDQERSTAEYEAGIRRDLEWLGLNWDDTFKQSDRFGVYGDVASALKGKGLLYACYETPDELERKRRLQRARGLPPVYDRAALSYTDDQIAAFEAEGRKPHWRFKLSQGEVRWDDLIRGETVVDTSNVSDPVLIRADGVYLYTLPSCVDDVDYRISHVIRGEDHVTNTAVQIELFRHLIEMRGGEAPSFAHHSLLVGADGQGLSKRLGGLSIETFREKGLEPGAITSLMARLGTSLPVTPERSLDGLAATFSFDAAGRAPARFDEAELEGLNAKLLHETPYGDVADRLAEFGVDEALWTVVRGNLETLEDVKKWRDVAYGEIEPVIEDADLVAAAKDLIPDDPLTEESWAQLADGVKARTGAKGKKLFMPLRLALTGQARGPEMSALLPLIGAARARARLGSAGR
ncbi:MAG: glutamate--tRNA ligase [Pseudomonadota bacterium]